MRRRLIHGMIALVALCLCACGKKNYLNENDALRAKVLDQQKLLEDLNRRTEELQVELAKLAAPPGTVSEDVLLATPHPVELAIGRLSHVRNATDGTSMLELYLTPADGRGRFIQLVGPIQINVFRLPMSAEPSTIGTLSAGPLQVRDAYRHTVMSTHYTFEVPLSLPPTASASAEPDTIVVRAVYTDGYTGQTLTAEGPVSVK